MASNGTCPSWVCYTHMHVDKVVQACNVWLPSKQCLGCLAQGVSMPVVQLRGSASRGQLQVMTSC